MTDRFAHLGPYSDPTDVRWYNRLAARHEHVVAKYCSILGASMAGIVAYEDRIAAAYLTNRPEVRPGLLGCVGLSGGGCRSALLQATWMFFPPGLPSRGDWPDLAASRAPSPCSCSTCSTMRSSRPAVCRPPTDD